MTTRNPVAIALSALFLGVGSAAALESLGIWLAWLPSIQQWGDKLVFWTWAIGAVMSGVLTWVFSGGVEPTWRRAALAVTSGFGAWGAGGLGFFISMQSMMFTSAIMSQGLIPAYGVAGLVVAFISFRVSRKHRVA